MRLAQSTLILATLFFTLNSFAQEVPAEVLKTEIPVGSVYVPGDVDYTLPVNGNEIKIMSYNVENLFDELHDNGKSDFEFLPKTDPLKSECKTQGSYAKKCEETDWTTKKVEMKLDQVARIIAAQGALPDILALCEVENENVLSGLAKKLGYKNYFVTNSPDERGIDVAVLYRQEKIRLLDASSKQVIHNDLVTRDLAALHFKIKNSQDVLAIYPNHWPSQANSSESRVAVAKQLRDYINDNQMRFPRQEYNVLILGDFNTIDADLPHAFKEVIYDSNWVFGFKDAHAVSMSAGNPYKDKMAPASYFYQNKWQELDHIFFSKSLADGKGAEMVFDSFRILSPKFAFKTIGVNHVPFRMEANALVQEQFGFSDHLALVVKVKIN